VRDSGEQPNRGQPRSLGEAYLLAGPSPREIAARPHPLDVEAAESHYLQVLGLGQQACAPSSPTATSASANSTGARARVNKPMSTSPYWLEQAEAEMNGPG
jgi:hypothetical protein